MFPSLGTTLPTLGTFHKLKFLNLAPKNKKVLLQKHKFIVESHHTLILQKFQKNRLHK